MSLRGLRVQLLLWTILPVALLLVMLAGAGIYSHREAMRDLVEERDHRLVLVEAGRLSRQVDALKATVADLAGEPGFHGDAALGEKFVKLLQVRLAADPEPRCEVATYVSRCAGGTRGQGHEVTWLEGRVDELLDVLSGLDVVPCVAHSTRRVCRLVSRPTMEPPAARAASR